MKRIRALFLWFKCHPGKYFSCSSYLTSQVSIYNVATESSKNKFLVAILESKNKYICDKAKAIFKTQKERKQIIDIFSPAI